MTVLTLRPNADSSVALARSTGSYNYACIDESTEDVTDYVRLAQSYTEFASSGHSANATDRYGFPDHSSETGIITKVTIKTQAKYSFAYGTSQSAQIKLGVYVNSTNYFASAQSLTTSDALYSNEWTTNPYTGVAWTWAEIDALQTLLYLYGAVTSAGPDKLGYYKGDIAVDCFQYWVESAYTLPSGKVQVLVFG